MTLTVEQRAESYRRRTVDVLAKGPERFWAKVDRRGPDECWPWLGATRGRRDRHGHVSRAGHWTGAHRYAYEITNGPVPVGLVLDHLCRNRICVNPAHLEPVTNRENLLRGIGWPAVNARKTHCPQSHEYTVENTYLSKNNERLCRTCGRLKKRVRDEQKRVAA